MTPSVAIGLGGIREHGRDALEFFRDPPRLTEDLVVREAEDRQPLGGQQPITPAVVALLRLGAVVAKAGHLGLGFGRRQRGCADEAEETALELGVGARERPAGEESPESTCSRLSLSRRDRVRQFVGPYELEAVGLGDQSLEAAFAQSRRDVEQRT